MAAIIVLATLGLLVAFVAVLIVVGLRLQRRGGRAPLIYLSVLAVLGLVFGIAGVIVAVLSVGP